MTIENQIGELAAALSRLPGVIAIGLSSDPVPQSADDGDIDLFMYHATVPAPDRRAAAYPEWFRNQPAWRLSVFDTPEWGQGDYGEIHGIETWCMHFSAAEAQDEVERYLAGRECGRRGDYYPTGRLAMVAGMTALHDPAGFLAGLREAVARYPVSLGRGIAAGCRETLTDDEDLRRAAARSDPWFFHAAAESWLDALLQLLYAVNGVYFPSRKRNREQLGSFCRLPPDCIGRIDTLLRLGAGPDTVPHACRILMDLRSEVLALADQAWPD